MKIGSWPTWASTFGRSSREPPRSIVHGERSGAALEPARTFIFWQEGGIGQIDRVKLSLTIFPQSQQEIGGENSIRDARFDDA